MSIHGRPCCSQRSRKRTTALFWYEWRGATTGTRAAAGGGGSLPRGLCSRGLSKSGASISIRIWGGWGAPAAPPPAPGRGPTGAHRACGGAPPGDHGSRAQQTTDETGSVSVSTRARPRQAAVSLGAQVVYHTSMNELEEGRGLRLDFGKLLKA